MPITIIIILIFLAVEVALTLLIVWRERKIEENTDLKERELSTFFITGDKHRNFKDVVRFCKKNHTKRSDVLIILGDSGLNYFGDKRDGRLKSKLLKLNITFACLYGNKENRPHNVGTYGIRNFCGGKVYYEPKYPNINFLIDGEIYNFDGREYLVVGGAHSVDKLRRIYKGEPYFEDEMPNEIIKHKVEKKLSNLNHKIYGILTHTCPIKYIPREMFLSIRQKVVSSNKPNTIKPKKLFKPDIDRSTEIWLDRIEEETDYNIWFCGHYHIDKEIDRVVMLYNKIIPLNPKAECVFYD